MERRLTRFIPSIRFNHISSEDFLLKVYPFKELLPNDLINNIFAHHLAPNNRQNINVQPLRKSQFDSIIITPQHINIFISWIAKTDSYHNIRNIPYSYKLLYRASKDGNTVSAFHEKCDNKGATIVIVKIKGTEQIVGGYNPFDWDLSCSEKNTTDSFIFSFTDRKNIETANVGYSNGVYSVSCHSHCGPVFGGNFYFRNDGTTWYINDNNYSISYSSMIILIGRAIVDYYEVFQVTMK